MFIMLNGLKIYCFMQRGAENLTTEKKRKLIIDVLFIAVVIAIIYFFMKYIAVWTLPFIIGLVVAIILQNPVAYLTEKTKMPRAVWSILLVLAVLVTLFGVVGLGIWWICSEAEGFANWLTSLVPEIQNSFNDISKWIESLSKNLPEGVGGALLDAPAAVIEELMTGVADAATGFAQTFILGGSGILVSIIFSVVASCYITMEYNKISGFILNQLSDRKGAILIHAKNLFVTNILKMLRGYAIIMFITFVELFLGLTLLNIEYALTLAVIIAILDILPVIGTGAVLIPWGIISMLMGNIFTGIGLIVLYFVIIVIRNVIEPRIIGKQVGLPPIVTLIAMYVGLKTFGVVGMMLFPVVTIILVKMQDIGIIHLWNAPKKTATAEKKKKSFRKSKAAKSAEKIRNMTEAAAVNEETKETETNEE